MNNFNLKKELAEQSVKDWRFGALSQPGLVSIPQDEREKYLPVGETQFDSLFDATDCASRSPINHLEALFTYHYLHLMKDENKRWMLDKGYVQNGKVTFSDRYIAVLSGTTHEGNSLKAPLEAIRKQGLIPKILLPKTDTMTWDEYYQPISQNLKDLGQEFLTRFTINYEQVEQIHFGDVLKDDMLGTAGFAWNAPDAQDVYHSDNPAFNHAFLIYNLPKFQIFDNYLEKPGDFTKNLAPDFLLFQYGYRVYVSSEAVPTDTPPTDFWSIIAALIEAFKKKPMPQSNREKLYQEALTWIGKDASPNNSAPQELSCAESVSNIVRKVLPDFPMILGTAELLGRLKNDPRFKATLDPKEGNIVINSTGSGNGTIRGHCGIFTTNEQIMANNSNTGLWDVKYTALTWKNYFRLKGGMPTHYFTLL